MPGSFVHKPIDPVAYAEAKQQLRARIAQSPVPEDVGHAENTLYWLLQLHAQADPALRLAAIAHDIERAREDRLQRHAWPDYDAFKAAHAAIGARMASRVLQSTRLDAPLRAEVHRLIKRHESGGDPRSDLLKDADSLSYFDHNLPFYFEREGWQETLRRARWGYQRLSARARQFYPRIQPDSAELRTLLKQASSSSPPHR